MKKVTVYTTQYCPYCTRAKSLLTQKGISFEEIDLTHDPAKREEISGKSGRMTVPVIYIGEELVGGSDELYALESKGLLEQKLLD